MKKTIREILDNSNGTPQILWLFCLSCFMAFRWSEAHGDSDFYKTKFVPKNHNFFSKSQATLIYQKTKKMYIMTSWLVLKQGFQVFFCLFTDLSQLCKYLPTQFTYVFTFFIWKQLSSYLKPRTIYHASSKCPTSLDQWRDERFHQSIFFYV